MEAAFPEPSAHRRDREAADEMKLLMGVITGIRNVRGEMRIPPSKNVSVVMDIPDPQDALVLRRNEAHIMTLAKVDSLEIEAGARKPEGSATAVYGENQIHVLLKGLLDFGEERKRLRKEIAKVEKEMAAAERKLGNRGFLEKAPAEIVAEVRERVEGFKQRLEKLTRNLEFFDEDDA
ncbi:MAG: hypothetical protein JRH05_04410 [Deltaproteobacteria bacterium]|nr:hypothetical protein [Deltaproteobacteria bacterium]